MKWGINEVSNYQKKRKKQLNLPKLFLGVVVVGLAFVFSLSVLSDSDKGQSESVNRQNENMNLLLKSHRMHVNYKNLTGYYQVLLWGKQF